MVSLQDLPKKVQYIIIDSKFVNGSNNTFSIDLTLESNLHLEDMTQVCGLKPVDFYVTQVGQDNPNSDTHISSVAKYIDITCEDIPKEITSFLKSSLSGPSPASKITAFGCFFKISENALNKSICPFRGTRRATFPITIDSGERPRLIFFSFLEEISS